MNVNLSHRHVVAITRAFILSRATGTKFTALTMAGWIGKELGVPVDWHLIHEISTSLCANGHLITAGVNDGNHVYQCS